MKLSKEIRKEIWQMDSDPEAVCYIEKHDGEGYKVEEIKSVYAAAGICDRVHEKTDFDNLMALWATLKEWHKELTGGEV